MHSGFAKTLEHLALGGGGDGGGGLGGGGDGGGGLGGGGDGGGVGGARGGAWPTHS